MAVSRKWLKPLVAVALLLLAGAAAAHPVSAAEEAVLIPGATLFKPINPFYPLIAGSYRFIGATMHDDETPEVVRYSQDPLATERALRGGVGHAAVAVRQVAGEVVVIGESMGSMVASRLAAELADGPDPPAPDEIRFVLIASPEVGVAEYFKVGTYIPILNYRVSRVQESPYPTSIVIGEYDPWADPPDRPWNLIATANAMMGMIYVHGPAGWGLDLADVPAENVTVRGTVTTYFVPTAHLPLTRPFRDLGVPDCVVDLADSFLRPIVDAGYRRHDQPGDSRPYFSDGKIRRDLAPPAPRRLDDGDSAVGTDAMDADASGEGERLNANPAPQRRPGVRDPLDHDQRDAPESTGDPDAGESLDDPDAPQTRDEPEVQESLDPPDAPQERDDPDASQGRDDPDASQGRDDPDPPRREAVG